MSDYAIVVVDQPQHSLPPLPVHLNFIPVDSVLARYQLKGRNISLQTLRRWRKTLGLPSEYRTGYFLEEVAQFDEFYTAVHIDKMSVKHYQERVLNQGLTYWAYLEQNREGNREILNRHNDLIQQHKSIAR